MDRRDALKSALLGVGSGALSLLAPKAAHALTADCSPATAAGVYARDVLCLPEGLVELKTAKGDIVELLIPANGITTLQFKSLALLEGLWQVLKPGTYVQQYPIQGADPYVRSFPGLADHFNTEVPDHGPVNWVYRHPVDVPGKILKGVNNSQMYLQVKQVVTPAASLPALTIDLVEFDLGYSVQDSTQLADIPFPPFPPHTVLKTIQFPAGVGTRNKLLAGIPIPWNARLLGIIRRTPVNQSIEIRLRSVLGPLEIV